MRLGQAVESDLFLDPVVGADNGEPASTISQLELSDDCRNAIQAIGYETISDLASKAETELLEQDGFTQAFVDEINNQLETLGLRLHSGNNVDKVFDVN